MSSQEIIKRILVDESRQSGHSIEVVVAELVGEMLLSDSADPCHMVGPEFIKQCDNALMGVH